MCFQQVRDWDNVAELVSVLPGFHPLSRHSCECHCHSSGIVSVALAGVSVTLLAFSGYSFIRALEIIAFSGRNRVKFRARPQRSGCLEAKNLK